MQSLHTLLTKWAREDVGLLPAEKAEAVEATFANLGSVATADVLDLYAAVRGMEKMNNECWRHWSLSEIKSGNKSPSPFGVLFADYLISSWCYRLKVVSEETSAVYIDFFDEKEPALIAHSLEEFFNAYIKDSRSMLLGHSQQRNDA
jgi:hypothetical protein